MVGSTTNTNHGVSGPDSAKKQSSFYLLKTKATLLKIRNYFYLLSGFPPLLLSEPGLPNKI